MREGWSDKELAFLLRIHERKISQSIMPALRKFGTLYRANPRKTTRMIEAEAQRQEKEIEVAAEAIKHGRDREHGRPAARYLHNG